MTSAGSPRRRAARAAQRLSVYMRVWITQKSMGSCHSCRVSRRSAGPGRSTGNRPFITGKTGRR